MYSLSFCESVNPYGNQQQPSTNNNNNKYSHVQTTQLNSNGVGYSVGISSRIEGGLGMMGGEFVGGFS